MSLTTGLAVFFVAWWLIFFLTLPFGVRTSEEAGVDDESIFNDDFGS